MKASKNNKSAASSQGFNKQDKHQKLDEENPQSQTNSQRDIQSEQRPQKINRDEIIEKLSQDMKNFNQQRKQGNTIQRLLMVIVFFNLQFFTLYVISSNEKSDLLDFDKLSSTIFWAEAIVTIIMYLYVSFKNPGYVTSYVLRGDEYEDDLDGMKSKADNLGHTEGKKQKHKIKRSILSRAAQKLSRQERLAGGTNSQNQNQVLMTNSNSISINVNSYQQVMDQSQKCTPNNKFNASQNRFIFSNLTTQNCDPIAAQNDTVNLDESNLNYSMISSNNQNTNYRVNQGKDKKVKIIAQFSKNTSRTTTLQDLNQSDNNHSFLDIRDSYIQDANQSKINPLEIIQKKIASKNPNSASIFTSEGDLAGKSTTATTTQGKQQLIDKGSLRSDDNQHNIVGFMVGESEVQIKRDQFRRKLFNSSSEDQIDASVEELDHIGQSSNDFRAHFDAIQEENEEDFQRDDDLGRGGFKSENLKSNNNQISNLDGQNDDQHTTDESPPRSQSKNQNQVSDQNQPQSIFHIENKYCTSCNLEQPLRTKHCRKCNRCVATYDHHCPWIGNCVAEKNRRFFFYFLLLQFIESTWSFVLSINNFYKAQDLNEWLLINILNILASLISFFFILMVGSLVFFHIFLSSNNLTTWEFLSWSKISYMKIWPKRYGSPFSQGRTKCQNLSQYFCPRNQRINYFTTWKMPLGLPELNEFNLVRRKQYKFLCFYFKL
ncbi:dhhc zinc finger domain containing protein [Stylonychia lemnae]|uniref:Palmitoyltransferase n=1 Tax=Stylonychia lemnae TaxID=5949 RepID=A0A078AYC6_STYLE|nr:dhhc zinc finger domain containing protein [Stylonychia lemnae]|eukprot:CDW87169.1 dhhc zinc finger domain containing protein [Stylonychia lemnae]